MHFKIIIFTGVDLLPRADHLLLYSFNCCCSLCSSRLSCDGGICCKYLHLLIH